MHLIIDIHPAAMFSFQVYLLDYWQQLSAESESEWGRNVI